MIVYQSNDYLLLREKLAEIYLKDNYSIFNKEYIVYQAKGIIERLPADLADMNGFFAGAEFTPVFKLQNVIADILGEQILQSLNVSELSWNIFKALGDERFFNFAPEQSAYYGNDEARRMQLSEKLAASFINYIEFQPELLSNWDKKQTSSNNPNEAWQAFLWRMVLDGSETLKKKWASTENLKNILQDLENRSILCAEMPRIFIFGISHLSNQLLQTLKNLDDSGVKIFLFLFNPLFKENISSINAEYFGKITFDNDVLLQQYFPGIISETISNNHFKNNNLNNLKSRLLNAEDKTELLQVLEDDSLSIHSCYTPVRELEALYQHLLYLNTNANENSLLPKDILVLLPDIEVYSPFISSVFESGDYVFNFPYSIEKQNYVDCDSAATLLHDLLDFETRNFTSEQILKLLENKLLADNLGVVDLSRFYEMLSSANICRDFKGTNTIENETYIVSFDYGLKRIAYGFALGEGVSYQSDGYSFEAPSGQEVFPVHLFEGSGDLSVFSKLRYLTVSVNKMIEARKGSKTLLEWTIYLKNYIIDTFIFPKEDPDDFEAVDDLNETEIESSASYFDKALDEFLPEISDKNDDKKISFDTFRILFKSYFSNVSVKRGSYNGGITFASYQSMQGLDYKFIAVLGLNYDSLPRNRKMPYFHLENKTARGSFNMKENDKYTFLQSILGAKEHLFLSYIGRSSKDNSRKPSSVFLEMVLNCFKHGTEEPSADGKFWIQQPLHAFSSNYNHAKYPLLKHFKTRQEIENNIRVLTDKAEIKLPETINLEKLIAFIKNPFKHYFNNALGIYLTEDDKDSLPEIELLGEPNHLDKYNLKSYFMESDTMPEDMMLHHKHSGILPLGRSAANVISKIIDEIEPLKKRYTQYKDNHNKENISAELTLKGVALKGTISKYGILQIYYCTSKKDSVHKYIVEAWIRHVFAVATGNALDTYLLTTEEKVYNKPKKEDKLFKCNCISENEAILILENLTAFYLNAYTEMLCYMPEFEFSNFKQFAIDNNYPDAYFSLAFSHELTNESRMKKDTAKIGAYLKEKIDSFQTKIQWS
jgi:exodeoxyribonuclease V gamma subunit